MATSDDTANQTTTSLQPGIAKGGSVQMGMPITNLGMSGQVYEPVEPDRKGPSKVLIAVGVGCILLAAMGVVRAIMSDPAPRARPRVESVLSEKVDQGTDAIKIARDVVQSENQRLDSLQQAVGDAEKLSAQPDDQ
jgi:hypothetical protein